MFYLLVCVFVCVHVHVYGGQRINMSVISQVPSACYFEPGLKVASHVLDSVRLTGNKP